MLRITSHQFASVRQAGLNDFTRGLLADLRRRGFDPTEARVHTLVNEALSFGITTNSTVSTYALCTLRLEKLDLDTSKLRKLAARDDIDPLQRVIVMVMLTERLASSSRMSTPTVLEGAPR